MSAKCIVLVVLVQLVLNLLVQNSTSFIYSRQNKRSLGLIMRETYTLKRISNFNREFLLMIRTRPQTPMYYIKESSEFTVNEIDLSVPKKKERFSRTADSKQELEEPCILTIENVRYNLTAWAKAHPGGVKVLQRFHNKDATKVFHAAGHSKMAYDMLKDFVIHDDHNAESQIERKIDHHMDGNHRHYADLIGDMMMNISTIHVTTQATTPSFQEAENSIESIASTKTTRTDAISTVRDITKVPRWRRKLFTKEDPIGIHKYMGIFCLLHFIFRYYQMLFTDPSAGYGTRLGYGPSWIPIICMIPHGMLSLSSLIFHTVPKERVVGQPMIWQEFRAHNIIFGLRSVITTILCSLSIRYPLMRSVAVIGSCMTCFTALVCADIATNQLRTDNQESTTATMPYWSGCSISTQKRFKIFYAYCQFMATMACFMVTNPAFPLAVLLAIQIASLLMTLVRKGLLSAKGYHIGYTISLILPYSVALRSIIFSKRYDLPIAFVLSSFLFYLRKSGISKYAIWIPLLLARITWGDSILNYPAW